MPGICGIIGCGSMEVGISTIRSMTNVMMHEAFYTSGTYFNEALNLCVGWVCHAESFADCMPVWNETKDVCLIFSGEDFTETVEIERLRAKGHECDSN